MLLESYRSLVSENMLLQERQLVIGKFTHFNFTSNSHYNININLDNVDYYFFNPIYNSIGLTKNEQFIKYIIRYHLFCKINGTL